MTDEAALHSGAGRTDAAAELEVEVRRSTRRHKTVSAHLTGGKMVLYLPASMTEEEERHWVQVMSKRLLKRRKQQHLNADGALRQRAQELNRQYFGGALRWESVEYVTNQSTRFGSCSPYRGRIRISSAVAEMPAWVRDYVLVHELAHLAVPNHSDDFWDLVYRYPLTERARGYLMAQGREEETGSG